MPYGIDEVEWEATIREITSILSNRVKNLIDQETISYSDLYNQIRHLVRSAPLIGPEDRRFHGMLDEVSRREHKAGRGMLSVLVVHQSGDMMPGTGFFELAHELGHSVVDKNSFWISEYVRLGDSR